MVVPYLEHMDLALHSLIQSPISVLKIPAKKLTAGVVDADDEFFVGNVDTDKGRMLPQVANMSP